MKNATEIGKILGMKAKDVNQLLKGRGFLEGIPGDYTLTDKGRQYANEKVCLRGNAGSARYGKIWSAIRWTDEILAILKW